jgi:hypothetical protein
MTPLPLDLTQRLDGDADGTYLKLTKAHLNGLNRALQADLARGLSPDQFFRNDRTRAALDVTIDLLDRFWQARHQPQLLSPHSAPLAGPPR